MDTLLEASPVVEERAPASVSNHPCGHVTGRGGLLSHTRDAGDGGRWVAVRPDVVFGYGARWGAPWGCGISGISSRNFFCGLSRMLG